MSFLEALWLVVVGFAFVAYLMIMFSIVTDLFRDRDASGWAKAAWVVALVVFPFVTSLVYLVARGGGMAERSVRAVQQVQAQQEAYIRDVAGRQTPADQIMAARQLLDIGAIDEAEFAALKATALRDAPATTAEREMAASVPGPRG